MTHKRIRAGLAVAFSLVLGLEGPLGPTVALATDTPSSEELQAQANSMALRVEEATASYQQALDQAQGLEEQIAQNEARTAEIEAQLPQQRERTAKSVRAMYILQQSEPGLLDLILSAEDFNEFITMVRYIDTIHERNADEIRQLADMDRELNETQAELTLQYDAAAQAQADALNSLDEARAAKRELQARANEVAAAEERERAEAIAAARAAIEAAQREEQERAKAQEQAAQQKAQEEAERQKAEEEAQKEKEEAEKKAEAAQESEEQKKEAEETAEATFTTSSGNTAKVEVPQDDQISASTDPITSNTTASETSEWAARIDAYLEGSPLAGYGETFAAAAAQYGVDPRLSPAISCVESSKGAVCFLPHNAWGWGSSSWSDWKTAIYDHVAGLAAYYDGTLTLEGARRYCPPTYQQWYSSVLAEMNSI